LGWAQAGYLGRIGSAGAAIGFSNAFERFFNVLAAARPGGFLAKFADNFRAHWMAPYSQISDS
jgi:hypothetical protein